MPVGAKDLIDENWEAVSRTAAPGHGGVVRQHRRALYDSGARDRFLQQLLGHRGRNDE